MSAAAAVAERMTDAASPIQVLRVPGHNLALLTLGGAPTSGGNGTKSLDAVRARVASDPSIAAGPPVYESPSGPVALVPVGEILVKFRAGVSRDERQKLLSKYSLEVRQENMPEPGDFLSPARVKWMLSIRPIAWRKRTR